MDLVLELKVGCLSCRILVCNEPIIFLLQVNNLEFEIKVFVCYVLVSVLL